MRNRNKITNLSSLAYDVLKLNQSADTLLSVKLLIPAREYRTLARIYDRIAARMPAGLASHRVSLNAASLLDRAEAQK